MRGEENRQIWTDVQDNDEYVVYGWMAKNFKMRALDLNVYAIIYHYCTGEHEGEKFQKSVSFIGGMLSASRQCVMRSLARLEEAKLIRKYDQNGVEGTPNSFRINFSKIPEEVRQNG